MYKRNLRIGLYRRQIDRVERNIKIEILAFIVTMLFTVLIILMSDINIYSKIFMIVLSTVFCLYGFGKPIRNLRINKVFWESLLEKEEKDVG